MDEQEQSYEIIKNVQARNEGISQPHVEFYLAAILKRARIVEKRLGNLDFTSFKKKDELVDSIAMKIINIGQIAFEMEIVFPNEAFWDDVLTPNGDRVRRNEGGRVDFGKISYLSIKSMRNLNAHSWDAKPETIYMDARSMCDIADTIDYILKNHFDLTDEQIVMAMSREPDEFQRITAIIDSRSDFGELLKITIFERHEKCDRYSCIREAKRQREAFGKIFARVAFSPDSALCERLFQHYDALGAFDELKNLKPEECQTVSFGF